MLEECVSGPFVGKGLGSSLDLYYVHHALCMCADGCEAETTVAEAVLGRPVFLEWPESNINETVLLEWDPCEDLTALRGVTICRTASRVCEANLTTGASWGPIHQQTFSGIARELCAVASVSWLQYKSTGKKSKTLDALKVGET